MVAADISTGIISSVASCPQKPHSGGQADRRKLTEYSYFGRENVHLSQRNVKIGKIRFAYPPAESSYQICQKICLFVFFKMITIKTATL